MSIWKGMVGGGGGEVDTILLHQACSNLSMPIHSYQNWFVYLASFSADLLL